MSQSPETRPANVGELAEHLRGLQARFGELRGRL